MENDGGALVHEAVGPSLRPLQVIAAIGLGVLALDIVGVAPVLLGALQDEHRLSASGIGLAAMLELISMGLSTGLCGALLPPRRLRVIGLGASLILALLDVASAGASDAAVLALRTTAGVPEGVMIWITVGMIARSTTPERWAALFFTGQVLAQLVLAGLFWAWVLPRFGASGGFWALGLSSLIGAPLALAAPSFYGALQSGAAGGGPPLRGWAALLATGVFVAGNGAVSVYLEPLAHAAGLSAATARFALVASLVAQVAGGALATLLAGRVRYITVFVICALAYLVIWTLYGFNIPSWLFIGATMLSGMISLLVGPFMTPMTIDADPSRRAAMQAAGAQIFGGAAGPLAAAFLVSDDNVRGVLAPAGAALIVGLGMIFAIFLTAKR